MSDDSQLVDGTLLHRYDDDYIMLGDILPPGVVSVSLSSGDRYISDSGFLGGQVDDLILYPKHLLVVADGNPCAFEKQIVIKKPTYDELAEAMQVLLSCIGHDKTVNMSDESLKEIELIYKNAAGES